LGHLRFGEPKDQLIGGAIFQWREMDFNSIEHPFKDYINTLCIDKRARFILIGTEEGQIYVFDLLKNKMMDQITFDKWINSLMITGSSFVASGYNRNIEGFSLKSRARLFRLKAYPSIDAYSSKGIVFFKVNKKSDILANVGYTDFKVFNAQTRKVLKSFSVFPTKMDLTGRRSEYEPITLNFATTFKGSTIALMVQNDPHLYFYNYKTNQVIKTLKLYDPVDLEKSRRSLFNTVFMPYRGYILVLLQFAKRGAHQKFFKTILYVFREVSQIKDNQKQTTFEYHFHSEIGK
jgi:WD40 repeat protein